MQKPPIYLYTDGASSGNPGPGGYGVVLKCGGHEKEMSEGFSLTTNNRMELLAVIKGLEAIKWENAEVHVYSDSSYVVNAVNKGWLDGWVERGWKTADKKPVKNQDLWILLDELNSSLNVEWNWVKGHAGVEYNEICDSLCQQEIKKHK